MMSEKMFKHLVNIGMMMVTWEEEDSSEERTRHLISQLKIWNKRTRALTDVVSTSNRLLHVYTNSTYKLLVSSLIWNCPENSIRIRLPSSSSYFSAAISSEDCDSQWQCVGAGAIQRTDRFRAHMPGWRR